MNAHHLEDRIVIVGGGIAGLATALNLAPLPVTLIVGAPLGQNASTPLAQGGIAAALGLDDHPNLHAADTIKAGAGLTDHEIADRVTRAGPACIAELVARGVNFDGSELGDEPALGMEAAHSKRRIVHAGGDRTGQHVHDGLIRAARATPSITILENARALDLAVNTAGAVDGLFCAQGEAGSSDLPTLLSARAVIVATGGIGGLFAHTTNPLGSIGSGVALAARAGAVLRDLEFVQFHPTAIAAGLDPMPLATEALRGEGAILVNGRGERFMEAHPEAELAPRDVVASAIFAQILAGERVFLDTRKALGEQIRNKFPGVVALCLRAGIDPVRDLIPVRPAAHYHMGGIKVDARGRSSIDGLWACGEVAATGLHGANRLASNSLLEALAFARWIADDVSAIASWPSAWKSGSGLPQRWQGLTATPAQTPSLNEMRLVMDSHVGVVRNARYLANAVRFARTAMLEVSNGPSAHLRDAALVSLLIATAAYTRQESRGAHQRSDYPSLAADAGQRDLTLDWALDRAAEIDPNTKLLTRRAA